VSSRFSKDKAVIFNGQSYRGKMTEVEQRPEWMDLQTLTQYADVSLRTLGDWVRDPIDPLPASRVGKKILVRRTAFDDYLEKHKVKPGIVEEILRDFA
jgi:hypothetical protein